MSEVFGLLPWLVGGACAGYVTGKLWARHKRKRLDRAARELGLF